MSQLPPISIVIPAYNEEAIIAETLAAVDVACRRVVESGLSYPEVIVVDNGSTDDTGDVAARAGAAVVYADIPGIAVARNAGAAAASASRLFFLDADTWVPENALSPSFRHSMCSIASEGHPRPNTATESGC